MRGSEFFTFMKSFVKSQFRRFLFFVTTKIDWTLFTLVIIYGIVFSYLSLLRYYSCQSTALDLGIFSQSLSSTLDHKQFFYNNLELGSHFHVHFSPILFMLLPIYAIHQSPTTLLIIQAFAIAAAAIPLYYLALQELGCRYHGLFFAALFLLYPALHGANLFDFHPEKFAPLFIISAFYFFRNSKWRRYFAFLLLALCTKEDVSVIAVAIGLYGLLTNRDVIWKRKVDRKIAVSIITLVLGFAWLIISISTISYFLKIEGYGDIWKSGYSHSINVYEDIGGDKGILGMFQYSLSNPYGVIEKLFEMSYEKLSFIAVLFLPLCMLPFMHMSSIALFLPTLTEYLLASNQNYFTPCFQYPVLLAPTIFIAAVYGVKKLVIKIEGNLTKKSVSKQLYLLMILSTLITSAFAFKVTFGRNFPASITTEFSSKNHVISLVFLSCTEPRILTQNDYFSPFSRSIFAYNYYNLSAVDFILVDPSSYWFSNPCTPIEYVQKYGQPEYFPLKVIKYTTSGEYGLFAQSNSLLLYKRKHIGPPVYFEPYTKLFDYHNLFYSAKLTSDSLSGRKILEWENTGSNRSTFWYGPYEWLPPGIYSVSFRLKISQESRGYVLTLDIGTYKTSDNNFERLNCMQIYGENFSDTQTWQDFTMHFELSSITPFVEFRGVDVSNITKVYLDYINVTQIAAYPNY